MMKTLVLRYSLFAVLSILINLSAQALVFASTDFAYSVHLAIVVGTGAGLLAKYYMDKKWIFVYQSQTMGDDAKKFFLYSLMGLVTTLVFWAFEYSFYRWVAIPGAQYIGALIGLSIGYLIKYYLDKKYVFGEAL